MLMMLMLLSLLAVSNFGRAEPQDVNKVELTTITGKVFRSDSNKAISNSYILLERNSVINAQHFDIRTDENGEYILRAIPAGTYAVSVYAWFANKTDVPCRHPQEEKIADGGDVTVEWQYKSRAFMEIATIKGFVVSAGQRVVKDFDIFCR
jgi:hypothetical protein